jgi:predicted nucleic-acid-binding protein
MYALDTSCLLRWLLWDNEIQAQVVDGYLHASKRQLQVADLALVETAWVLKSVYEFEEEIVARFLQKIIEHKNINCNRALFERVLPEVGGTPRVSLADICLAYYAGLSDAKVLLTFDKMLAKRFPRLVKLAQ